jgi:endonuclease-8
MPEGPSIIILKEAVRKFTGKKIIDTSGNTRVNKSQLINKKIIEFRSWGKHFLICFKEFTYRIHFLMFGSYEIDGKKPGRAIRLQLKFKNGEINFYTCSIKILEGDINDHYDWSVDVLNDNWNPRKAKVSVKKDPDEMVCDVLLDQNIFAGVGNIIKNEVLYRIRLHPESLIKNIPDRKIKQMVDESRIYSFQFLEWKKKFELRKHWLAHTKKVCTRCGGPIIKKITGKKKRRSFICEHCQKLY